MTGLPADAPFVPAGRAAARRRAADLAAALLAAVWDIRAGCGVGSRQFDRPTTACTIPVSEDGTWAPLMFARNVLPFGMT